MVHFFQDAASLSSFTPPGIVQQPGTFVQRSGMFGRSSSYAFSGLMVAGVGSVRVSGWLQAASDGHCAKAGKSERGSDCTIGNQGSFVLGDEDYLSRRTAAHACLLRCTDCAQCRYISVSSKLRDCSWCAAASLLLPCERRRAQSPLSLLCARRRFRECSLGELRQDNSGFISGAAPKNTTYTVRRVKGKDAPAAPGRNRPLRDLGTLNPEDDRPKSTRPQTVLLVLIDNPNAITRGGVDPRPLILLPVARELRARGHAVVLEGAAALSRRAPHTLRGIAAWRAEGFTFGLSNKVLKQYGPPTLAIVWFVERVEPEIVAPTLTPTPTPTPALIPTPTPTPKVWP